MTDPQAAPEANNPKQPSDKAPAQVDPAQELEALRGKYARAQEDLAKFRTRASEVEAAQKAAEEKALAEADAVKRADLLAKKAAELEAKAAEADARAVAAERRAALTGKVADATAALKLLDPAKHLDADGNVKVDTLLADYPFLKPTATPHAPTTPAPTPNRGPGDPKTLADAVKAHYGG